MCTGARTREREAVLHHRAIDFGNHGNKTQILNLLFPLVFLHFVFCVYGAQNTHLVEESRSTTHESYFSDALPLVEAVVTCDYFTCLGG